MWHRVAPALAQHFSLVIPDLPGYGWSAVPEADARPRALRQALDGQGHDRGDGEARPRALPPRRPRPRRPRRLSAGARSSRPRRAHGDARHRADLRHVARHGPQHGDEGLALAVPGAAGAAAGNADRESAGRISGMEDGELDQGQEPVRLRSARARALPRGLCRSAPHPRPLRGLPRRPLRRSRATTRPTAPPARPSPARCWRCGAASASPTRPAGRSRSGGNGRRRPTAKPIDSGHFLTEENPDATATALLEFFTAA